MTTQILRLPDVRCATGHSRSQLYSLMDRGLFPRPIRISARTSGWPLSEVEAVSRARIAGATNEELAVLVERLVAQRGTASSPRSTGKLSDALVAVRQWLSEMALELQGAQLEPVVQTLGTLNRLSQAGVAP